MVDYGFVPATDDDDDKVIGWLRDMVSRRVPKTNMRTASDVHGFITGLNHDLAIHPAGDLVIGAHANSAGQWSIRLYPNQVNIAGGLTGRAEYENIEQILEMSALGLSRRIRIDDSLVGWSPPPPPAPPPPPTHFVHLKGCNLGKALPFLTKLKEAFGNHVLVTAPKHTEAVVPHTVKHNQGSFEYMCYEFELRTAAIPDAKGSGFHGFETRADLVTAFDGAGHEYLGGIGVPTADWEKWVPKDFTKEQSFYMALPLGRTVAGFKELTLRPSKKSPENGARKFKVYEVQQSWPFSPPASATTQAEKIAALKTAMQLDARFTAAHPWPVYQRAGYASMDDFMAGHHWTFPAVDAAPPTIGRRIEYAVTLPIANNSGAKPILIFNFYPALGAAQAAITTGLQTDDRNFFAEV
jgi:hypothetical protein